jgi:hypothetical protein
MDFHQIWHEYQETRAHSNFVRFSSTNMAIILIYVVGANLPATGPYPEPDESIPHFPSVFP